MSETHSPNAGGALPDADALPAGGGQPLPADFSGWVHADAWTAEEEQVLLQMRAAGATLRQIAGALGRSVWAVQTKGVKLKQRGVDVPVRRSGPPCGTSGARPPAWTAEEIARVVEMYRQGCTWTEIGTSLGRPGSAARMKIHALRKRGLDLAAAERVSKKTPHQRRSSIGGAISAAKKRAAVAARQERPCLRCRKPFRSEWIGNRICDGCKNAEVFGS